MLERMKWIFAIVALTSTATAQETDITQTPNAANAGIKKSYAEQVGAGRGDVFTPGTSRYIVARDPFRAIARGRQLFQRKFTSAQGLGPRTNDGVGDIETDASHGAGLSDSCASCHGRPQGAAGFGGDVFTRPASRDAPHLFGLGLVEMLGDEITAELRAIREEATQEAASSNHPVTSPLASKGIEYGTITAFPDGSVDTAGVVGVDPDLRVRPFFAEGSTISIREFLVGAFNAEMGLETFDPDTLAASLGSDVTTPSGFVLSGSTDAIEGPPAVSVFDDPDLDGVLNEIPANAADFVEFYLLNYFKPALRENDDDDSRLASAGSSESSSMGRSGRRLFDRIGCAVCHVPDLEIEVDRRVAEVDTVLDRDQGNPFNNLFATAQPLLDEIDDGLGLPTLKVPKGESFLVRDFYADLKRHDVGSGFWELNFDGSLQKEFVTEPLWGVGSTAPYGHDGRSPTLEDVILRHGGEALAARYEFEDLSERNRGRLIDFLQTLVLFSPPATASNLGPVDTAEPDYPVQGHGSIDLSVLFDDPTDKE